MLECLLDAKRAQLREVERERAKDKSLQDQEPPRDISEKEVLEIYFVFATVWALGGGLMIDQVSTAHFGEGSCSRHMLARARGRGGEAEETWACERVPQVWG